MLKKILQYIFLFLIISSSWKVEAKSKWDVAFPKLSYMEEQITEEITPIRNDQGKIKGFDVLITIPKDYAQEKIQISPNIFSAIEEYKYITPNDKIKINLKIKNASNYKYQYVDQSFMITTEDKRREGVAENFTDTNAIGFDGQKIDAIFSPYRTWNTALIDLYQNTKKQEASLSDETLSDKLKEVGYQGIEELDGYYLDYYNEKYDLNEKSLDQFTDKIIKEIFSGTKVEIKESNSKLIELAYNFFYNKLISYTFSDQKLTDENSEDYSIGTYMRKRLGNDYLKDTFAVIEENHSKELKNMSVNINGKYTTNIFLYYHFYAHLEFQLQKENVEKNLNLLEEGEIIPPKTGIS